jgi:hypothetical protein
MMENHFTELGEATFFSPQPFSSSNRISRESLQKRLADLLLDSDQL